MSVQFALSVPRIDAQVFAVRARTAKRKKQKSQAPPDLTLDECEQVIRYKGSPPVNTDEEREAVVKACKWVDEVVLDVPYVLDQKYLDEVVFGKYKCDFVVHGDDPCLDPDGNDVYALTKRLGKYIEIKRTEGVSTTDLLGRMLQVSKAVQDDSPHSPSPRTAGGGAGTRDGAGFVNFLPTSRRISEFSSNRRPQPGDKIVYVDGSFDLFHLHHIEFLRRARALGDFLIVGVHKDEVVNQYKGYAFPVMNLMERVLAVLACRYVDEVVIGAPWEVTQDLLNTFNVSVVAHGGSFNATVGGADDYHRAYRVPKEKGMYHVIVPDPQSPGAKRGDMQMVTSILDRVEQQRTVMSAKFAKKAKAEQNYYENVKTYVQES